MPITEPLRNLASGHFSHDWLKEVATALNEFVATSDSQLVAAFVTKYVCLALRDHMDTREGTMTPELHDAIESHMARLLRAAILKLADHSDVPADELAGLIRESHHVRTKLVVVSTS